MTSMPVLRDRGLNVPSVLVKDVDNWRGRRAAVLFVAVDGEVVGVLSLEDSIRPESREAVSQLHGLGVKVAMITGDARQVAEAMPTN